MFKTKALSAFLVRLLISSDYDLQTLQVLCLILSARPGQHHRIYESQNSLANLQNSCPVDHHCAEHLCAGSTFDLARRGESEHIKILKTKVLIIGLHNKQNQ
jgi:hypothetical protein